MTTKMGNIFDIQPTANRPKGDRNDTNLKAAFPGSPQYNVTDIEVTEDFEKKVLRGIIDNGLGFSEFSRDFDGADGAPDLGEANEADVNVFAPSVSSDLDTKVAAIKHSSAPFSGEGNLQNPKTTSGAMKQLRIGSYSLGKRN